MMNFFSFVVHNTPWYLMPVVLLPGGGLLVGATMLGKWHQYKKDHANELKDAPADLKDPENKKK